MRGFSFTLAIERPVGFALVHLHAGAAVHGEGLNANVLEAFSHFHDVFGGVVPAQAGFYSYWQVRGLYNGFGHFHHLWNILQQGRPGAPTGHVLHRAAVVDINQVGTGRRRNLRRLPHGFDVTAEELDANGPFVLEDVELLPALGRVADEPFRRNELCVHQVGAVLLANGAEGRVADVLHRGQQQRKLAQYYVSDFNHRQGYLWTTAYKTTKWPFCSLYSRNQVFDLNLRSYAGIP
jgi:hypothetical protein